jgi:23S rRNA (uracil1939-C5)-methyltransferase
VVYLSCDPATLARDDKRLSEAGYRLDHIEAFDLFPNTAHVETLAVLTRHASG